MDQLGTDELLAIWTKNDRVEWTDNAFEAIKETLLARGATPPIQKQFTPIHEAREIALALKDLPVVEIANRSRYHTVQSLLKPAGMWSILWGLIAIVTGLVSIKINEINAILALIGVFLVCEGVWISRSQKVIGLLLEALAFASLGVWNLTLARNDPGAKMPVFWGLLGAWQCLLCYQRFGLYGRLSKLTIAKPARSETLKSIDNNEKDILAKAAILGKSLAGAQSKHETDLLEFSSKTFRNDKQVWKGLLLQDCAVFADASGEDIIFAKKSDVQLLKQQGAGWNVNWRGLFSKKRDILRPLLNVYFRVGDRKLKGIMPFEYLERFQVWKG